MTDHSPHGANVYPAVHHERVEWRKEATTAALLTAYSALFGAIVGLVWHAIAPRVDIVSLATRGSFAAMKPLIGADVWLGTLGIAAGVLSVLALAVFARDAMDGPGGLVGLAAGGVLGMLVAARVGHLAGIHDLYDILRPLYSHPSKADVRTLHEYVRTYDLRVRAQAVLLAWPFVAVLLNGVIVAFRAPNQARPITVSAYPGSS